jgi:hypothetical protein
VSGDGPEGVTLHLRDGAVLPAEVVFSHVENGIRVWVVTHSVDAAQIDHITIAQLPAKTALRLSRALEDIPERVSDDGG